MKIFRTVSSVVNQVGGGVVKAGVNVTGSIVGTKFPNAGDYIKEVGDTVVESSRTVISNAGQFADGASYGVYGAIKKDRSKMDEGWDDVKAASTKTAKGVVGGLTFTGKSVGQTVQGAVTGDREKTITGLKNVGKVGAVSLIGVGLFDFVVDTDLAHAEELETRNMGLAGSMHEVTGVSFEHQVYEADGAGKYAGVFPSFDAAFEVKLPADTYEMSDQVHIGIANMDLYEAIQENPALADKLGFDAAAIENLQSSVTPEGYDWHHHEEVGRMQLVDEEIHSQTGHTGGRSIWGGGTEMR